MCYHSSQTSETKESVLNHKNLGGGACCEYKFLYAQFYRIKGGDARGAPPPTPSPVIFEMTKLTPENYISLESRIYPIGYLPCLHTKAVHAMFLGLKFHLKGLKFAT